MGPKGARFSGAEAPEAFLDFGEPLTGSFLGEGPPFLADFSFSIFFAGGAFKFPLVFATALAFSIALMATLALGFDLALGLALGADLDTGFEAFFLTTFAIAPILRNTFFSDIRN